MRWDAGGRERMLVWITASKVLLSGALCASIALHGRLPVAIGLLVAYVISDQLDGIWARAWRVDTVARRMTDAIVDKVSIHSVFLSVVFVIPSLLVLYLPLLVRDLIVAAGYFAVVGWRRVLFVGASTHKLSSITCAVFGAGILSGIQELIPTLAMVAIVANYVLLADAVGVVAEYRPVRASHVTSGITRLTAPNWAGLRYLLAFAISRGTELQPKLRGTITAVREAGPVSGVAASVQQGRE